MECVLIVQLPIHVMKRAKEQTMQLTIEVNKTDSDSGFTRSQKFATFPQNVLLRVAYT